MNGQKNINRNNSFDDNDPSAHSVGIFRANTK